jgi:diguanylate cyclase (GGDEF)-like protein
MVRSLVVMFTTTITCAVVMVFFLCVEKEVQYEYFDSIDLLSENISNSAVVKSTGLLNLFSFLMVMTIIFMAVLVMMWGTWCIARNYYKLPLNCLKHYIHDLRYKKGRASIPKELDQTVLELAELTASLTGIRDDVLKANRDLLTAQITMGHRVDRKTNKLDIAVRRLEKQSKTDVLTEVSNRRHFEQVFFSFIEKAYLTNTNLVCIMIDIDNFKIVNDHHGHSYGDALIQFCGKLLRGCIRDGDFVARYGGDEFVLLLPNTDIRAGECIAQRIASLFVQGVDRFRVNETLPSLSIGLSLLSLDARMSSEMLFDQADEALYRAKGDGRNCVRIFLKSLDDCS